MTYLIRESQSANKSGQMGISVARARGRPAGPSLSDVSILDKPMQKYPRLVPVPPNRPLRHPAKRGDIVNREPTEKLQVHQLGQLRIRRVQRLERFLHPVKLDVRLEFFWNLGRQARDLEAP